jgi:hypothetical protein
MASSFWKFEVASESAAGNAPANSWAALLYHTNAEGISQTLKALKAGDLTDDRVETAI